MSDTEQKILAAIDDRAEETVQFLCELLRFPSTPGQERDALAFCAERFAALGLEVERIHLTNDLRADPDYSDPIPDLDYTGHFNVRVKMPGQGGGRSLLFNTHCDVVPPSQMQESPFDPRIRDGILYARGACDAKGQIAALYLTLAALKDAGIAPAGDVVCHLVVEEECGGNGTLAMARTGEKADAAVILEPTALKIYPSVRGAVWFRLACTGRSGHSGKAGLTVSALKSAIEAITLLEEYHDELLAASRGLQFFDDFPNPMPITFGKMRAGDWPATAPQKAVVEGVLGLLPNKSAADVAREMNEAIRARGSEWLRDHYELYFMYRHDSHVLDPAHPLVATLGECCLRAGVQPVVTAMTASCDSWLYNNQLGIPSVVFGVGDLSFAHSNQEQIALEDLTGGARILADFICTWCR